MKNFHQVLAPIACLLMILLLSSCVGSNSDDFESDIEVILQDGPTIVDITSTSATLVAVTTVDLVCGVAYGTTVDYGWITTDDDMAGGGHREHRPKLVGLQPDTVYHYRLGGIGPDGIVYRSRDYTFRTLSAPEGSPVPEGDNLALETSGGTVIGVSSNYGAVSMREKWGGSQAIDGDHFTAWSSNGDGDSAWIEIELSSLTHVTYIGVWTRTMGSSAQIYKFQVTADEDDSVGPFELPDSNRVYYFPVDLTAKIMRFEVVESNGGNTGVVEIEVFGEPQS